MDLKQYNNKRIKLIDIDGQIFQGICIFEDKDTYDEKQDGLSVKIGYDWVKIFENEIKSIEVIQYFYKLLAMDKYKKQREFVINRKSDLNLLSVQKGMYIYELR